MSDLTIAIFLISAAFVTMAIIYKRHKKALMEAEMEDLKERQAIEKFAKAQRVQKYKQLQIQLKDPLIQSLWSLLEEAFSLALIEKFSNEQFKVSYDDQSIELAMSWIAKEDGVSQLALRRLAHKHATDIANLYQLSLLNMVCDEKHLELQFSENTIE